ncbi:hypothetical protein JCM3770_000782 [Rhodotorula araucariae]
MPRLVALAALLALAASLSTARRSSPGPARLDSVAPAPHAVSGPHTVGNGPRDGPHRAGERQTGDGGPFASSAGEDAREAAAPRTKHKRCVYIGTFFHAIDCDAPANSTSIPYAPREPFVSARTGGDGNEGSDVATCLVTAQQGTATGAVKSG